MILSAPELSRAAGRYFLLRSGDACVTLEPVIVRACRGLGFRTGVTA